MRNILSSNKYKMTFDSERFKDSDISDYIFNVNIPSLELGTIEQSTNIRSIPTPGESITFSDMSIQLVLDEDMNNYLLFYNWLYDLSNFNSVNFDNTILSDSTIVFLTNKSNSNKGISIKNMYPYSISGFPMNIKNESDEVTIDVSFKFQTLEFLQSV
jgi:hypothetical protein